MLEGNSIRVTVRMTGVAKNTVAKLLVDLGSACARYEDEQLRKLPCRRVRWDEIWSFVGARQKNVSEDQVAEGWGDVWTWTAIDVDTKLVPCWMVGQRGLSTAREFIGDLASRLSNRVQLTVDGHRPYLQAVEETFGADIDFAQLIKVYGASGEAQTRYSPGQCIEIESKAVTGPSAHLYIVRRAPESHYAHVDAPLYSPNKRILKEAGEPHGSDCAPLYVLQFCSDSSDDAGQSRNGGWRDIQAMGCCRHRCFAGLRLKLTYLSYVSRLDILHAVVIKIGMVYPDSRVVWFTGMSGAGKSTLCQSVASVLRARGVHARILDGDDLRSGLCADLGFTVADRRENVRRVTHAAGLLAQDGPLVLVALISPLHEGRQLARSMFSLMTEVFVDAPLAVCEARDPKGLYRKARDGMMKDFTGIDSPYERPESPDVVCRTDLETVEESTSKIIDVLVPSSNPLKEPTECQRRPCIAVDFDGTLANYDGWTGENMLGTIRTDVVRVLRRLREKGWQIIVHTTRSPQAITQHLLESDVPFDDINRNTNYSNPGCKPVATIYWDDRALRYSGDGERDMESILNFRTWSGRL